MGKNNKDSGGKKSKPRSVFSRNLEAARVMADCETIADGARKLGVEYETYRSWEDGRTEPNTQMLRHIGEKFDVSVDFLVGLRPPRGQSSPPPHTPARASST